MQVFITPESWFPVVFTTRGPEFPSECIPAVCTYQGSIYPPPQKKIYPLPLPKLSFSCSLLGSTYLQKCPKQFCWSGSGPLPGSYGSGIFVSDPAIQTYFKKKKKFGLFYQFFSTIGSFFGNEIICVYNWSCKIYTDSCEKTSWEVGSGSGPKPDRNLCPDKVGTLQYCMQRGLRVCNLKKNQLNPGHCHRVICLK